MCAQLLVDALGFFELVFEDDDAAGGFDGGALVDEFASARGDAQLVARVAAVAAFGTQGRDQAVFALSQRPNKEGVPALIRIVRTNRDPEIRKKALFWLAQSQDPRALDLIEELLTKR